MNILWLVNIVLPEAGEKLNIPYSVFGGWLTGALNGIRARVDAITVAAIGGREVKTALECDAGNVHYIVFPPMSRPDLEKAFSDYLGRHNFDAIHIYGTEMEHSAAMIAVAPPEKTVVNIQGLTYYYYYHYLEGIPYYYTRYTPLNKVRYRCKFTNRVLKRLIEEPAVFGQNRMAVQGEREKDSILRSRRMIGRTKWDKACVMQLNPKLQYYHVNETLRGSFYTNQQWELDTCERHSIFLSQASYPIKGLHYFIRALKIVKEYYPDVKVYIGGGCGIAEHKGLRLWRDKHLGGYWGYINSFIRENGLYDRITLLGFLNEEQMAERYLKSNVFVCPSTIENSPNSVGEAMMLGTPVVASYVGGIPDMLDNGKEGLLYQTSAPYMLADCIMRIFADDDLALTLSRNAIKRAHETHDREKNAQALLAVYHDIISKTECENSEGD